MRGFEADGGRWVALVDGPFAGALSRLAEQIAEQLAERAAGTPVPTSADSINADLNPAAPTSADKRPEPPDPSQPAETPTRPTPDPETPIPEIPDPEIPTPETPDPETSTPEIPDPQTPTPDTPAAPNPAAPTPAAADRDNPAAPEPLALDPGDDLARLNPPASRTDAARAEEFRRLTRDDLDRERIERLTQLAAQLRESKQSLFKPVRLEVDPAEAGRLAATFNDLRLVLAQRLELHDAEAAEAVYGWAMASGPGSINAALYVVASLLQDSLIDLLLGE